MLKEQEILCLIDVQRDLIMNGKIKKTENSKDPFECMEDADRLRKLKFYDLSNKYAYGWYIAETETLEGQLAQIWDFIKFIMNNYHE